MYSYMQFYYYIKKESEECNKYSGISLENMLRMSVEDAAKIVLEDYKIM